MKGTSTAACSLLLIYYERQLPLGLWVMQSWRFVVHTTSHTVCAVLTIRLDIIHEDATVFNIAARDLFASRCHHASHQTHQQSFTKSPVKISICSLFKDVNQIFLVTSSSQKAQKPCIRKLLTNLDVWKSYPLFLLIMQKHILFFLIMVQTPWMRFLTWLSHFLAVPLMMIQCDYSSICHLLHNLTIIQQCLRRSNTKLET